MKNGFELRKSSGKGEGIFATKSFMVGDIVMVGVIKEALDEESLSCFTDRRK